MKENYYVGVNLLRGSVDYYAEEDYRGQPLNNLQLVDEDGLEETIQWLESDAKKAKEAQEDRISSNPTFGH